MDTINKAVALSILNERNAEGTRFGDALMDALYEVGLGRDLPAEEWDDVLLDLVGRLAGWLQDGVTTTDCGCDVATMKLLSPIHPSRYIEMACGLHGAAAAHRAACASGERPCSDPLEAHCPPSGDPS